MKLITKIKNLFKPMQQNSDGYHTFRDLYQHRLALVVRLAKHEKWWKSRKHSDGTMFDGYFVCGRGKAPGRQMTYHFEEGAWYECGHMETLDKAPEWDGHSANDVILRLVDYD